MEIDRLRTLLDAYGGDPHAWPEDERDAGLALLARSADARRLHEAAVALDEALDALPEVQPSAGLEERIAAAALASEPRTPLRELDGTRARRRHRFRLPALASAVPLAAAAALGVWLYAERAPVPRDAAVPPAEIALADLGVYQTPGDELLDVPVVDGVYEAEAWTGCPEAGLGCLELDVLPLEPVSRGEEERILS